jgi:hypothetical protein
MALDIATTGGTAALDRAVGELQGGERAWARTPLARRRELLLELAEIAAREATTWVESAARIKGLDATSPLVGEEWIAGPYALLSSAHALAETLRTLASGSDALAGYSFGTAPGGRTAIEVLPHGLFDRLLLPGYHASVWMRPGVGAEQIRMTAGLAQRTPEATRGVALVLGAGNITSIAPLDVIYQLFAENRVVLLKINPLLEPPRPVLERIFAPFTRRDLVRVVGGGGAQGAYLAHHPGLAAVHITGSAATHDAIVFGDHGLQKPITSELGGVSPIVLLPGRWSERDLRFQAEHVATMKLHNAGHNCIAGQILVLPAAWPQKQRFLELVQHALAGARRGRRGTRALSAAVSLRRPIPIGRRPTGRFSRSMRPGPSRPGGEQRRPRHGRGDSRDQASRRRWSSTSSSAANSSPNAPRAPAGYGPRRPWRPASTIWASSSSTRATSWTSRAWKRTRRARSAPARR